MELGLIIQLISGAVGGNVAGGLLKNFNLGTIGNSIAGIVGGGIGGQLLGLLSGSGVAEATEAAGGAGLTAILGDVAAGGVGGGALMAIVGVVKNMMNK